MCMELETGEGEMVGGFLKRNKPNPEVILEGGGNMGCGM